MNVAVLDRLWWKDTPMQFTKNLQLPTGSGHTWNAMDKCVEVMVVETTV